MKSSITIFFNQKGGVGKTTTAINIAAQAALKGRTLLIDTDKQANLSLQFGQENPQYSIRDVFLGNYFEPINVGDKLDVIPATIDFSGIDLEIQQVLNREKILARAIEKFKDEYSYIFIDCPPDVSLVTINCLACADYVIIPIKAAQFSLDGVGGMIEVATRVKEALNPKLSFLGLLLTHYDERLKITKYIYEEIRDRGWEVALFETKIRSNTAIENSQYAKKTIFEYDRKSNGALDYMKLGMEVQNKIKKDRV